MDENNFGRPRKPLKKGSLGARIRKARLDAGYTSAKQLADKIGVSQSAISQLETETINPRGKKALSTMIRLARELGRDFGEAWLRPYVSSTVDLGQLQAALFDDEVLRNMPDDQLDNFLHVIGDAYRRIEAMLEGRKARK